MERGYTNKSTVAGWRLKTCSVTKMSKITLSQVVKMKRYSMSLNIPKN